MGWRKSNEEDVVKNMMWDFPCRPWSHSRKRFGIVGSGVEGKNCIDQALSAIWSHMAYQHSVFNLLAFATSPTRTPLLLSL